MLWWKPMHFNTSRECQSSSCVPLLEPEDLGSKCTKMSSKWVYVPPCRPLADRQDMPRFGPSCPYLKRRSEVQRWCWIAKPHKNRAFERGSNFPDSGCHCKPNRAFDNNLYVPTELVRGLSKQRSTSVIATHSHTHCDAPCQSILHRCLRHCSVVACSCVHSRPDIWTAQIPTKNCPCSIRKMLHRRFFVTSGETESFCICNSLLKPGSIG
jgi:hypothetical protein